MSARLYLWYIIILFYAKSLLYSLFSSIFAVTMIIIAPEFFDINNIIVSYTTDVVVDVVLVTLWMADKIVSYTTWYQPMLLPARCEWLTKSYHIQPTIYEIEDAGRCEWLTKSYHIQRQIARGPKVVVVNGWQNRIIYNLTNIDDVARELWMADKIVSYTTGDR